MKKVQGIYLTRVKGVPFFVLLQYLSRQFGKTQLQDYHLGTYGFRDRK